jgi:hypothetical protein
VTNTAPGGAAGKAFYDRAFFRNSAFCLDVDSPNHNPDWGMDDTVNSRKKCMFLCQNTPKAISECPFGHLDG